MHALFPLLRVWTLVSRCRHHTAAVEKAQPRHASRWQFYVPAVVGRCDRHMTAMIGVLTRALTEAIRVITGASFTSCPLGLGDAE